MKIFNCPQEIQQFILNKKQTNQIGFVPTMGNLHQGHLSLCQKSINENDITVVSIYVNQTQFNNKNDFDNYPQTFEEDIKKLTEIGVDIVFAPSFENMYPDNFEVKISCDNDLAKILEGKYRKNHFTGMLCVVMKLLNIVNPHNAYFGKKDFQQLCFIKHMAKAYFLTVNIIGCPIVRDEYKLPLSSRNRRLNNVQLNLARKVASIFNSDDDLPSIKSKIENFGVNVEYIEIYDNHMHIAYYIDDVRLIDNKKLSWYKICIKIS